MVDSMVVQKDLSLQKSVTPVHNGISTYLHVEFEEEEKTNQYVKINKSHKHITIQTSTYT